MLVFSKNDVEHKTTLPTTLTFRIFTMFKYDDMHTLDIGECRTGAKSVHTKKWFDLYLLFKTRRTHRLIHVKGLLKVV